MSQRILMGCIPPAKNETQWMCDVITSLPPAEKPDFPITALFNFMSIVVIALLVFVTILLKYRPDLKKEKEEKSLISKRR